MIQNLDPEKSSFAADNEANDESKSSGDDIPKNSGFIVGNPESKQVDSTIKVTEGNNTFDTPQKIQVMKPSPKKQKVRRFWHEEINLWNVKRRPGKHSYP